MPSTINADTGAITGTTGIVQTADGSGELSLQANGNTVVTLTTNRLANFTGNVSAGNVAIVGAGSFGSISSTGNVAAGNVTVTGVVRFADNSTQSTAAAGGPGTANVQSANFTAVSGFVYAVNTAAAAVTVTLPATPAAGNFLTVIDYARTFATNNCILSRNGSNIAGTATNTILGASGTQVTLFYVDSTQGWLQASGSTSTFIGGYSVTAMAVAGGGGSGELGGGGGGGGMLTTGAIVAPGTPYSIVIGAGGAGGTTVTNNGVNTTGLGITALGGGYGAYFAIAGGNGGSGGGGSRSVGTAGSGTAGQGNAGGFGAVSGVSQTGGGGGAGAAGQAFTGSAAGAGGAGASSSISGSAITYAGGGGGGGNGTFPAGGGGSGGGASGVSANGGTAGNGTANLGGGGGGGPAAGGSGGSGGSGIFIISYPGSQRGTGGTITSIGGNTIHTFTTSGTYTA
jgi:hypothetical protein